MFFISNFNTFSDFFTYSDIHIPPTENPFHDNISVYDTCFFWKTEFNFIIVDMHGETTSEKMAMGHLFDGKATMVVGTHTHVPTSDHRIMEKGTAYQTDIGMCGDYNSVIGMNRENSLKKFLKDSSAENHFPALGEATISGLLVTADDDTGLAKKVQPIVLGGSLEKTI